MQFSVAGVPVPQGSKTAQIVGRRVWLKRGRTVPKGTPGAIVAVVAPRAVLTDQADRSSKTKGKDRLKKWRERVALVAHSRHEGPLWTGPVVLSCEFVFPRPPSHWTKAGAVRKGKPEFPKRDIDKLVRAISDALTGVVYEDDAQVVQVVETTKRYSRTPTGAGGVVVTVERLEQRQASKAG